MQHDNRRRRIGPRPDHAVFQALGAEIEEAGIGKGHDKIQMRSSARNLKRWILPVAVLGSSLRNSIQRGYLYGASLALTCSCSARMSASLALSGDFSTTKAFGLIS